MSFQFFSSNFRLPTLYLLLGIWKSSFQFTHHIHFRYCIETRDREIHTNQQWFTCNRSGKVKQKRGRVHDWVTAINRHDYNENKSPSQRCFHHFPTDCLHFHFSNSLPRFSSFIRTYTKTSTIQFFPLKSAEPGGEHNSHKRTRRIKFQTGNRFYFATCSLSIKKTVG